MLPTCLACFGGASFIVTLEVLGRRIVGCSVNDLSSLAAKGFTGFSCLDGFIAVDMQIGVPAWTGPYDVNAAETQQRDTVEDVPSHSIAEAWNEGRWTIGKSAGNRFGFV